jgi:peptidyl-prolyl cis-trans isomerase SurA
MPSQICAPRIGRFGRFLPTAALAALLLPGGLFGAPAFAARLTPVPEAPSLGADIVAVVNGDVVSRADVDHRRRLFALSTGLPMTPEVLQRLTPQVTKMLIDERLRLQEVQRRKVVVSDKDIADAIGQVERQNNMPPGALRHRLAADGVDLRTLIDQIRVQVGWGRVLRQQLADQAIVSDAEIAEKERLFKAQTGKPEYRVAEIFIPVDDPGHAEEAQRFADTVIQQLHSGASFAVVAAQFSQSQTALQGGDLGWVQPNQVDPAVARVVAEMPVGAVSNPIRAAGGFSIVTLHAKRQIGNDPATVLKVARVLLQFATPLDPAHPTDQQRRQAERARQIAATAHSCEQLQANAKSSGSDVETPPPTEMRLETVAPPQLHDLLAGLPEGKASQPLISKEGVGLVMICAREEKNLGTLSKETITNQLIGERIELVSRQLLRDLRRRAVIDTRGHGAA